MLAFVTLPILRLLSRCCAFEAALAAAHLSHHVLCVRVYLILFVTAVVVRHRGYRFIIAAKEHGARDRLCTPGQLLVPAGVAFGVQRVFWRAVQMTVVASRQLLFALLDFVKRRS